MTEVTGAEIVEGGDLRPALVRPVAEIFKER